MTTREICERLLRIAREISSSRGRISNVEDVYKAVDYATDALDSAYEGVISLMLGIALPDPEKEFYDMAMRALQSPTDRQGNYTDGSTK